MRETALFCEDYAHSVVVGTVVGRVAKEWGLDPGLRILNAAGGHGMAVAKFARFVDELRRLEGGYCGLNAEK